MKNRKLKDTKEYLSVFKTLSKEQKEAILDAYKKYLCKDGDSLNDKNKCNEGKSKSS